jgi:hypothetical protein
MQFGKTKKSYESLDKVNIIRYYRIVKRCRERLPNITFVLKELPAESCLLETHVYSGFLYPFCTGGKRRCSQDENGTCSPF